MKYTKKILKLGEKEKTYTWKEIIQELHNETEEEAREKLIRFEKEYKEKYGKEYNWSDITNIVKETELYTR